VTSPLRLKRQSAKSPKIGHSENHYSQLVAAVLVDTPVSHLEGIYDYLIPQEFIEAATIGTKVIVDFNSKMQEGLIVDIKPQNSDYKLKPINKLNSPSGLVGTDYLRYLETVRNRFGGSLWTVIKQAIPSRVAKEELGILYFEEQSSKALPRNNRNEYFAKSDIELLSTSKRVKWAVNYSDNDSLVNLILEIIEHRSTLGQVLIVVPDGKDFQYLSDSLSDIYGSKFLQLGSHLSKSIRYRNFLRILLSNISVIITTRSGALAPLRPNSTVVVISDIDESHYEIHAPGWNTRDVSLLRSSDTSLIFISTSHSLEIERLISLGWLERKTFKSKSKRQVISSDNGNSYISVIKNGLTKGNVLVSVAEKGYSNLFLCSKCRNSAICSCGGKLKFEKDAQSPECNLCGKIYLDWTCGFCGNNIPYVVSKGIEKNAEEIGRALPKSSILISSGAKQVTKLPSGNHIVLATIGSEPNGDYSAVVLLNGEKLFNKPTLRAEEVLRYNWFNILAKTKLQSQVYVSLLNNHPLSQAILRGSSSHSLDGYLREREKSKLPPYFRFVKVWGVKSEISKFSENLRSSYNFNVDGPIELDRLSSKIIIRCALSDSQKLVDLLDDITKLQGLKRKSIFQFRFDSFDF
jgi:primosomal protein N' (replication factor Y)